MNKTNNLMVAATYAVKVALLFIRTTLTPVSMFASNARALS